MTTLTTKSTEIGAVLVLDGQEIDSAALVTMQAAALAGVLDATHVAAVKAAYAAGAEAASRAFADQWPSVVEQIHEQLKAQMTPAVQQVQIAGLRDAMSDALATTVQRVHVEALPVRLETREVERDRNGAISRTRAVIEDVPA